MGRRMRKEGFAVSIGGLHSLAAVSHCNQARCLGMRMRQPLRLLVPRSALHAARAEVTAARLTARKSQTDIPQARLLPVLSTESFRCGRGAVASVSFSFPHRRLSLPRDASDGTAIELLCRSTAHRHV